MLRLCQQFPAELSWAMADEPASRREHAHDLQEDAFPRVTAALVGLHPHPASGQTALLAVDHGFRDVLRRGTVLDVLQDTSVARPHIHRGDQR